MYKWCKISVNTDKSTQITFATKRGTCQYVTLNNTFVLVETVVKYLGLHLDEKVTLTTIWSKGHKYALVVKSKFQLTLENILVNYITKLRSIWTYGIELWCFSRLSNTEILKTFQSKTLRLISNASWHITNHILYNYLGIPYVTEVIGFKTITYKNRNTNH